MPLYPTETGLPAELSSPLGDFADKYVILTHLSVNSPPSGGVQDLDRIWTPKQTCQTSVGLERSCLFCTLLGDLGVLSSWHICTAEAGGERTQPSVGLNPQQDQSRSEASIFPHGMPSPGTTLKTHLLVQSERVHG